MRIGCIGVGSMGAGIARSLARAGHEVTIWNRSAERAHAVASDAAAEGLALRVADDATEAARAAWGSATGR